MEKLTVNLEHLKHKESLKSVVLSESLPKIIDEINRLAKEGLNRRFVYELLRYTNFTDDLTENENTIIGDFLGELTGFRSALLLNDSIRFPDEPLEHSEFVNFIRQIAY